AGSAGMTGAAALAATAVLRTGAGVCTLAVPASLNPVMETKLTEVMTVASEETPSQALAAAAAERLLELMPRVDAVLLGPGIGQDPDTARLVLGLLERVERPLVLDADGINCVALRRYDLRTAKAPLVLTPHYRELARLTGEAVTDIAADPLGAAARASARFGCTVLLKGAHTVVAAEGRQGINLSGTSAMATAGSGDVLAGVIAALLSQGVEPFTAACCGAHLHGRAGELAEAAVGGVGMLAGDMLNELPRARAAILKEAAGS
ncbi:MAG: NAD(P)H-hydrate dehydratase, partial [Candidatus Geothermincolia bacterium]